MIKPIIYVGQTPETLFGGREETTKNVEATVREIIEQIKLRGDSALKEYCLKFDGFSGEFEVSQAEFDAAFSSVSKKYIKMLSRCVKNVSSFHKKQLKRGFEIKRGNCVLGQKVIPVARAGIYVPGGTAAYPSTVLMNAIPAKIAGVKEIIMATPAKKDGKISAEVLVAAKLCNVDKVFKIGGAQAIAALAYGTESVPKADKITGPGRDYVAAAKRLVSGVACGIDMIAGPSEILVVADESANAAHVAADMLSQAEHDVCACALLVCTSEEFAKQVDMQLEKQILKLPRKEVAQSSLEKNGKIIVADSVNTAIEISNAYAPEHLELAVSNPFAALEKVRSAGSVFLGGYTPEAVGDYFAGTNHTLPTSGSARFASPLGVEDFLKYTQYVYFDKAALKSAQKDIALFARSEGLEAHAISVEIRGANE